MSKKKTSGEDAFVFEGGDFEVDIDAYAYVSQKLKAFYHDFYFDDDFYICIICKKTRYVADGYLETADGCICPRCKLPTPNSAVCSAA